jgi:hypothetical protein
MGLATASFGCGAGRKSDARKHAHAIVVFKTTVGSAECSGGHERGVLPSITEKVGEDYIRGGES